MYFLVEHLKSMKIRNMLIAGACREVEYRLNNAFVPI